MIRSPIAVIGLAASLLVASAPRTGLTEPTHAPAKTKAAPATQADMDRIDRIEKKVAEQQRILEKLLRLQQQYLSTMTALITDSGGSPPPAGIELDPKPEGKPPGADAKPDKAPARSEARPVQRIEPKKRVGTIVGKVRGGAGNVFLYIEDVVAASQGSAVMKQEGKQFVPRVLAVQKGTRVEFPNLDTVFHNVFSVTPDTSFDLGSYHQGETRAVTLTHPGVVNVYCNMHSKMTGYILVVQSSLYVRAGQDGFFRLPNVPTGKHRLVAWAPNAKPVVSEVVVADDRVVTSELEVKPLPVEPHTNKDGLPYGSYKD